MNENSMVTAVVALVAGAGLGWVLSWLVARATQQRLMAELAAARQDTHTTTQALQSVRGELSLAEREGRAARESLAALDARVGAERTAAEEKLALVASAEERLKDAFSALATEVLHSHGSAFLNLAGARFGELRATSSADLDARKAEVEQLVGPLREGLERLHGIVDGVEKQRISAFSALETQLKAVTEGSQRLQVETQNLAKALRAPQVRGRWGELQLRNVVQLAGMEEHTDFAEQATVVSDDGRLRPDMLVRLPGGKVVVVDSKVPLQAYLDALEAPDEATKDLALARHATQLRTHMDQLASKSYWDQFAQTPDFVVLFVPGESFLAAACQEDPGLYERGFSNKVLLAGPATLVALLKTIAYGWRQELVARSAEQMRDLGQELHDRIAKLVEHFERVGKGLRGAVEAYNSAVGTLEGRVLVTARRFRELGVESPRVVGDLPPVEVQARSLQAIECDPAAPPGRASERLPPTVPEHSDLGRR